MWGRARLSDAAVCLRRCRQVGCPIGDSSHRKLAVVSILEVLVGLIALYVGAVVLWLLVVSLPFVGLAALVGAASRRVDHRPDRALRWSVPVEDVSRALIARQATSFRVRYRRFPTGRELELLFFPLDEGVVAGRWAGRWHVFCPPTGRGCFTAIPMSGREIAARLCPTGPDSVPAAEALDLLMATMHKLVWATI